MISDSLRQAVCLAALMAVFSSCPLLCAPTLPQAAAKSQSAVVDGGSGPCTADFLVTDSNGKGIFGAKIDAQIRFGFGGFHKLGITITTDAQGKAHVQGLPDKVKGATEFKVSFGGQTKSFSFDPIAECHPSNPVIFTAN